MVTEYNYTIFYFTTKKNNLYKFVKSDGQNKKQVHLPPFSKMM